MMTTLRVYRPKQEFKLQPGDILEINYTDFELVDCGVEWTFTARRLKVIRSRDLLKQPLTVQEYLDAPFTNRGRWSFEATDLDSLQSRWHQLACVEEYLLQPPQRIGLFDGHQIVERIDGEFAPTRRDRAALCKILLTYQRYEFGGLRLGIYANDEKAARGGDEFAAAAKRVRAGKGLETVRSGA